MPKSNGKIKKNNNIIYMDYASASLKGEANPSAIHAFGVEEKNKLESARGGVARILGAHTNEIIFTSGTTESNNLSILGLCQKKYSKIPHIITTNIEHASVLEVCRYLERTKKAQVTYVAVKGNGKVDVKDIKKSFKENTILVSIMYANNEIGSISPLREISKAIRHWNKNHSSSVLFHTDATQAVNYLDINVEHLGVDMMSFGGAKIYGPKGVGVLYKKRKVSLEPIMFGGNQEEGLRPGTENVRGIVELACALELVEKNKNKEKERLTKLQEYFLMKLKAMSRDILNRDLILNGEMSDRLPNNINITIPNIPADLLVIELSARGVMTSSKSACKTGDGKSSYVIQALRSSDDKIVNNTAELDGSLRFTLGRETKRADIDYTIKSLFAILQKLKRWYI